MKLLKRTSLSILIMLFLASLSSQGIAQAGQDSIRTFSWEGLSLGMTPDQMVNTLVSDGYTKLRVTGGKKKKSSIYQKKTAAGSNKVQFTEKNSTLIKLIFSETKAGGKKYLLSTEAANGTLSSIKSKLGIDDSSCTPAAKGGGACNGQPGSSTHNNSFSVSVKPRVIKITLSSNPISQAVMERKKEMTDGLASAYGCLGTTDITSAKEIYDCIESVLKELGVLDKAKKINRSKHMPVYLGSTTTPCWQLVNFYKRGLSYVNSGSDAGPIPSCETFAAAVKLSVGSPPFWSGCLNEEKSDEFLKSCIDGVNPSYFKLVNQRIPTCKDYQQAYQRGIVSSKNTVINASAVTLPECEYVITFAKSLRESLTQELLGCAGYDPDNAQEHIVKCVTSDRDLRPLSICVHVQAIYRTKLMQSNYGYLPDKYRPIACEETKDLLAKADTVRERLKEEEAEERRQALLRRKAKEDMREAEQYGTGPMAEKLKEAREEFKKRVDERYGDTAEKAATRTSKLEKEIKANGGDIKLACKALGRKSIFCPPTLEEIRLAMMRNHSRIKNLRMLDGHMLHGDLNVALVELHYREPRLLQACTSRTASSYDCYFALQITDKFDMRSPDRTVSYSGHLRYIKRDDYSYYFWIGKDGLWQADRAAAQVANDQAMQKRIQAQLDFEEEMHQMDRERARRDLDGLQAF